jgi:hypothetical protein
LKTSPLCPHRWGPFHWQLKLSYVPLDAPTTSDYLEWVIPNPTGFLVNGVPISDPSGFNVPDVHYVMATVSLSVTWLPIPVVDQIAVLIADFSQRKFGEAQYISGSRMSFIIGDKLGANPSLADVVPFFPPLSLLLPGGAILSMSPIDYLDLSGSDVLTPGTPTLHANVALGKAAIGVYTGQKHFIGSFVIGSGATIGQMVRPGAIYESFL